MGRYYKAIFTMLLLSAISFQLLSDVHADTIRTRDGREIKGIVVEDYNDRIVFSTIDGETTLMKQDIQELYYDSEDDNLVKLAELARDGRDYGRAYSLYEMALKINPKSRAAKDGQVFLQGYLFRKEEVRKQDSVKRQEDYEKYGAAVLTEKSAEEEFNADVAKLRSSMGVTLDIEDGIPTISNIQKNSPASDAGLKKSDRIIAVWGRLTGYIPLKDIVTMLLEKTSLEVKFTIGRTIVIDLARAGIPFKSAGDLTGAGFKMEFDGLTVSDVKADGPAFRAGLKMGDNVTAIDGRSTRYMPLKEAMKHIADTQNSFVKLTVKREILIWRKN